MPSIAYVSTDNPAVTPAERFRECFSQARDALATVSELDIEMARCLDQMRQQNESPARMIVARAALDSVREVAAVARRIAPQTTTDARDNTIRVA